MKYIKNELHNQIGHEWMNDCLTMYIEKDVALRIDNESIMQQFMIKNIFTILKIFLTP